VQQTPHLASAMLTLAFAAVILVVGQHGQNQTADSQITTSSGRWPQNIAYTFACRLPSSF
jgi:hypothetical protein